MAPSEDICVSHTVHCVPKCEGFLSNLPCKIESQRIFRFHVNNHSKVPKCRYFSSGCCNPFRCVSDVLNNATIMMIFIAGSLHRCVYCYESHRNSSIAKRKSESKVAASNSIRKSLTGECETRCRTPCSRHH